MQSAVKWIVLGGACVAGVLLGVPQVSGLLLTNVADPLHGLLEDAVATFGIGGNASLFR